MSATCSRASSSSTPEPRPDVVLACIDIGSNTTRLLAAERRGGKLRELVTQRAFTRIGKSLLSGGEIPKAKIEETADVVATQCRVAKEVGAVDIVAVATAAIREAANRDELAAAVEDAGGMPLWILTGEEEARLAFVGATRTMASPAHGTVAVVDVGGGSTELAIGSPGGTVEWAATFRIGAGHPADSYLRSDPPAGGGLENVRSHVEGKFGGKGPPPPPQ